MIQMSDLKCSFVVNCSKYKRLSEDLCRSLDLLSVYMWEREQAIEALKVNPQGSFCHSLFSFLFFLLN